MPDLRFEVKHLGNSALPSDQTCDLDIVKLHLSQLISANSKSAQKKSKKNKDINLRGRKVKLHAGPESMKLGKAKGLVIPYEDLHHFYSFVEYPGLLVLNMRQMLIFLQFKTTSEMDQTCNHIESIKGPTEATELNTPQPNLSLQINGSFVGPKVATLPSEQLADNLNLNLNENITVKSRELMERFHRPITLVAEIDIQPPEDVAPSSTREGFPVSTAAMSKEVNVRLLRGQHAPLNEQPHVVRNIYTPFAPRPFDWEGSVRKNGDPGLYGSERPYYNPYQDNTIDCEIINDYHLSAYQKQQGKLPRENLYGPSTSKYHKRSPVEIIRENDMVPSSSLTNKEIRSVNGTHWAEYSKRLTYNTQRNAMEEDENGEIFWYVAHEIPQSGSDDGDATTLTSSNSFL